jgi:hypothetical protein
MSPDDRTKELVRYRIERLRLFAVAGLATIGGVLNLLLGELSGRRLFLAIGGIILLAVLVGLTWREDAAIWSLLKEDDHA